MASFLRKPFSALTSLGAPPPPGSVAFAAWKRFTGLSNAIYRASGGRLMGSFDGNPVLLLHHVGRRSGAGAHDADSEQRARLWPRLVEHYPALAGYQARTEREIPVVILSPRG